MRTAVITLAAGRHQHLALQHRGLAAGSRTPDHYVVVAMDDPELGAVVGGQEPAAKVVDCPVTNENLPLARARNLGAARAVEYGAELLVFLDVDCVPGEHLLKRYQQAAEDAEHRRTLLCGTVSYLPPPGPHGYPFSELGKLAEPHPRRPAPAPGELLRSEDYTLFWSLSFAVTTETWHAVGGFCEEYDGYGGEDTDYGQQARVAGVPLTWVGGAPAFHQHHPVSDPPVAHLHDILRNAETFHRRWGWWPMTDWLHAFAERGLAHSDPATGRWFLGPQTEHPRDNAG
ncbi:Glycosyltransferase, GT2 family [Streptomyces sp. MnatMP-M77]|uniref:glycosyltransferase family 2 protein n=1 Tax=unclassified Streptomyces TaxID=2593676 RepID=UPI000804CC88|nr:galactosyltransferase-related protein [Streptomyces sp. MnatMP-M77]MYT82449.1 glycosyltransferase family 2 protein [Streptomyces sp. SID8364]SBU96686.1 Glycosyltransferase, GT2 family [Streptomyces sp. MnatMP-M77]